MQLLNQNLVEMMVFLADGQYHDGTSIGEKLNITRAGIWKNIKKLEQYGIQIESIKGKGYRLLSPLILLDQEKIQSGIKQKGVDLEIFEKVDSTNEYLKQFAHQNKKIRVCMAEMQTKGKGRFQRLWHSPFGQNIYLSMLYPFQKDISELSGLSLVVGLAVCRTIESFMPHSDSEILIKWPNDILVDHQKLAGILIEIEAESHGYSQVVIGIGINVNISHSSKKDISQAWTSLLKLSNAHYDRNELSVKLIQYLIGYIKKFTTSGLTNFMDEWKKRDALLNKPVNLLIGKEKIEGVGAGINEFGHLQLKTKNHVLRAFSSGDATILK